eukprot:PITA_01586
MIDVLRSKNLWRLVNGEHKKAIDAQALIKSEEKCDQARGLIGQTISHSLQVSIEEEDNLVEVWIILASLFDKSDDVSSYYLEKKIHELDPTNFDRVELYLVELKTLNEKLNNCGKYYKKTNIALITLVEQKLSSCFDMFIQTRNRALELSQSTMEPTFDGLCKGLINEQERLITLGQVSPNKAPMAHNKKPTKSFKNAKGSYSHTSNHTNNNGHASYAHHETSKRKKVYDPCKHCGKTNHLEKNCFKAKHLMAKANNNNSNESQVALCASVASSSNSSSNVEWIMDSGASKHMIGCVLGKHHREMFDKGKAWRAKAPLQLIHSDTCGPLEVPSISHAVYFIIFIDDFSRKYWIYFLKNKRETLVKFQEFKSMVENASGTHKKFWAEAICCATCILNRVPTKVSKHVTLEEKWNGHKPDISNFKVFGCECWAHIPDEKWKKLEPKSHKCIFIGYDENSKAYMLFYPSNQNVIIRRDVQFHGDSSPPQSVESHVTRNLPIQPVTPILVTPSSSSIPLIELDSFSPSSIPPKTHEAHEVIPVPSTLPIWARKTLESVGSEVGNPSGTHRTRSDFALMTKVLATDDPTTYAQAKGKPHWEQAMSAKYESLLRNKTWFLVPLPLGKN